VVFGIPSECTMHWCMYTSVAPQRLGRFYYHLELRIFPKSVVGQCEHSKNQTDLRAGLDDLENRKFLTIPGLELRPLGRPARS
jgi:hypothetical protein